MTTSDRTATWRARIEDHLARMYDAAQVDLQALAVRLAGAIGGSPEALDAAASGDPVERWSERDAVLITYGNTVSANVDLIRLPLRLFGTHVSQRPDDFPGAGLKGS